MIAIPDYKKVVEEVLEVFEKNGITPETANSAIECVKDAIRKTKTMYNVDETIESISKGTIDYPPILIYFSLVVHRDTVE